MTEFIAPLFPEYTLMIPEDSAVWIAWGLWFCMLVAAAFWFKDKDLRINQRMLFWMALLSIFVLIFSSFFGFYPEVDGYVGTSMEPIRHLMLFAVVPLMIAGGLLGLLPSMLIAGMSGALLAYLDTHNIFTPLLLMSLAVIFSWFVRQRYRTKIFKILRFPFVAALVSFLAVVPLLFISSLLTLSGSLAVRIGNTFTLMPGMLISFGGMVLSGGIISSIVKVFARRNWGQSMPLQVAPGEKHLKFRLVVIIMPILVILLITLLVGYWFAAEKSSRRAIVERLTQSARIMADELPVFYYAGEFLINQAASESDLLLNSPETVETYLAQKEAEYPFFEILILTDLNGILHAIYSQDLASELTLTTEEIAAIGHVMDGKTPLVISANLDSGRKQVNMSFLSGVAGQNGLPERILFGRTGIFDHPYLNTFSHTLAALEQSGGDVQIIDAEGSILYHSDPALVKQAYAGSIYSTPTFFETNSIINNSQLNYYQPVEVMGWSLLVSLPTQVLYEMTWQSVFPLLLFSLSGLIILLFFLLVGISPIVKTLNQMRTAVTAVSSGNYDIQLRQKQPMGELGQLTRVFMNLVGTLRKRLQKQSDLDRASQQLVSQHQLSQSLEILMKTALAQGVSSVRILFSNLSDPEMSEISNRRFGMGKHTDLYAPIDHLILEKVLSEGQLVLRDHQIKELSLNVEEISQISSIIALPLTWGNKRIGVLWVTYQNLKSPDTEDIGFYQSLSQNVSLAILNTSVKEKVNLVRKRLEAVLDSLAEAVLILGRDGFVNYHNRAAAENFGKGSQPMVGKPISSIIDFWGEITKLDRDESEHASKEISLPDGKVYQVIVKPLSITSGDVDQMIMIEDITHHNAKESLNREFVTTVSHELRSPLTLIHGYAKILRLTGNLNDQQDGTMLKIIDGIEEMKHLVQNLLDIGRLESGASLEFHSFDAVDLVQRVVKSMEAQARQKNIELKLTVPSHMLTIVADDIFLTQALKNLIENAIKFTKMGGEVSVGVYSGENNVVFSVEDNGIGIAPLDQSHLFKKFHRVGRQTENDKDGSGLGLAIVKSIAERHDGKVWVESQLGKGSVFYLEIPRQQKKRS